MGKAIFFLILLLLLFGCNNLQNKKEIVSLEFETRDIGFVNQPFIFGEYIFGATDTGLIILSQSQNSTYQTISKIDSNIPFSSVFVTTNYAFVTYGLRKSPTGGLKVFDISDITNPKEISNLKLPNGPISVLVKDNIAFVGDYSSGALLIDVKDPTNPKILSNIKPSTESFSSYESILANVLEKYDLSTEEELFTMIRTNYPELTQDKNDSEIREFITNLGVVGHSWWMKPVGNILYLPYDGDGIYTVDITNPSDPKILGNFNKTCFQNKEKCYFNDVEIVNNFALVALDYGGLLVLDISNPREIKEVNQIIPWQNVTWANAKGHMIQIKVKDDYAFMTAGEDGLYTFNISDPKNPMLLQKSSTNATINQKGCAWGIDVKNSTITVGYATCIAKNPIKGSLEVFKIN